MSIFNRLSNEEILETYNAAGLLLFFVPVYLKMDGELLEVNEHGFPVMHEVNWVPKALFFLASIIYGATVYAGLSVNVVTRTPVMVKWRLE
jgi:hypothetical protein